MWNFNLNYTNIQPKIYIHFIVILHLFSYYFADISHLFYSYFTLINNVLQMPQRHHDQNYKLPLQIIKR